MDPTLTSSRQIPEHSVSDFLPKRHDYVLVIPVLNEGERIRHQIGRIAAIRPPVDIVIADGGSKDGSLDSDLLKKSGVRALLIKKGPGRLSAQLRVAYAWALDQGYLGIVTIDGNGKDDVAAIGDFVEKLRDGYDYVQGSRYIAGGKDINTPIDRKIGGRMIHAPVMSLSGRHFFTDTTNGFRGYSARYLLDPRVAPFRDVFRRYELLFYLTVRAGQLGYRIIEIPVIRSYPKGERTPTKINGFRGRLVMLGELFSVALGRFDP
ncbi:glycosyltransferase family 2 protein [Bradyrhizobium sp. CB82]|uniref:glycosyltransferase family 2 protein n=1 Tax=Bradyrhizobium sp. CB82 TaxID=3039159 RepID=UPI0024B0F10A|nr:glycosyltransferase family 2 protein [Bradyrhizobium sp. CB82]WFU38853.1 glycosyltransferase family 2 protein [Bradyrhizobium sp. CB82]